MKEFYWVIIATATFYHCEFAGVFQIKASTRKVAIEKFMKNPEIDFDKSYMKVEVFGPFLLGEKI